MKRTVKCLCTSLIVVCFLISEASASEKRAYPTTPVDNNGKKWRIGYLEGGPYINYPLNLRALVQALAELGWMDEPALPPQPDETDTRNLWVWLSGHAKSRTIEFVKDAYWSNGWEDDRRQSARREIIARLNRKKDIDLMLAMGTKAGQDLAANDHSVPTIVLSASDPLRSGIIKSIDDSGYDHLNARVDPTRYERQLKIFHDIFQFKKLGVVYEHGTQDGRTYAAIDDVEKVAKERGFEVVSCHAPFSNVDKEEAKEAVLRCHRDIADKIDAFYFTNHRGVTLRKMPKLMAPLIANKIPTFSQVGSREVKYGVLLSIARAGFKYVAMFHAETIARIFNGAKPRELEQLFEDPPRIAINLKTAQEIGYDPSVDILGAADEIYDTVETIQ